MGIYNIKDRMGIPHRLPIRISQKRRLLHKLQSGLCYYCREFTTLENWTVEHRQPLARGGTNGGGNTIGACSRCNHLKGNKTEQEFIDATGCTPLEKPFSAFKEVAPHRNKLTRPGGDKPTGS